jgi:hypothetical protein
MEGDYTPLLSSVAMQKNKPFSVNKPEAAKRFFGKWTDLHMLVVAGGRELDLGRIPEPVAGRRL